MSDLEPGRERVIIRTPTGLTNRYKDKGIIMILDTLKNLGIYRRVNPLFKVASEYLEGIDRNQLEPGRYEVRSKEVYALVQEYTTRPRDQGRWEAHRKYTDLHFLLRGEELMGFANIASLRSLGDYDSAKDVEHLEGDGIFLTVPEGYFVVFGPEDAHMPCLEPGRSSTVKKVVLKIRAK